MPIPTQMPPRRLTPAQIRQFHDSGHLSPIRVMTASDAAAFRARLEASETAEGSLMGTLRSKSYLLFTWANEIVRHPSILDVVEDIYGPDLLVYATATWIKEPGTGSFVSWHQDSTYFGLEPLDNVTVWLALSRADSRAGCMRVLPGSHKLGQLPSRLAPADNNLLSSGQNVVHRFNEAETVEMPLEPGEISLHHACTIHGSPGNHGTDRRIGFSMHIIPAHVRPMPHLIAADAACSAMLVRGRTHHDLFPLETPPSADADAAARQAHAAGVASYRNMMQALGNQTGARFD